MDLENAIQNVWPLDYRYRELNRKELYGYDLVRMDRYQRMLQYILVLRSLVLSGLKHLLWS